jgi:uncharacterized delta-60 repeat protein
LAALRKKQLSYFINTERIMDMHTVTSSISFLHKIIVSLVLIVFSFCLLVLFNISLASAADPGTMDNSFSGDGIVTVDFNGNADMAADVAIQPDGKILAAGTSDINTATQNFSVVRMNGNGSLDTTFAANGVVQTFIIGDDTRANRMALQADGKIVVAGISGDYGDTEITVVRYTANGELDPAFGSGGIVKTAVVPDTHNWGNDVAIQPDGKILVAGTVWNETDYDFVLLRYDINGSLDNTFATNGIKIIDLDSGNWDFGYTLALQKDGKIIIAGRSGTTSTGYDFALVRLNSDGTPDASFGTNGVVITHATDGYDSISRVTVQLDGKIIAVGMINGSELAIARYSPTGTLDTNFDSDGIFISTLAEDGWDITLQADEKILVSGFSEANPTDLIVARLTIDGNLDSEFGNNGYFILNVGEASNAVGTSIALQRNGQIITSGWTNTGTALDPNFDFLLVRLHGDSFSGLFTWPMFLPAITNNAQHK